MVKTRPHTCVDAPLRMTNGTCMNPPECGLAMVWEFELKKRIPGMTPNAVNVRRHRALLRNNLCKFVCWDRASNTQSFNLWKKSCIALNLLCCSQFHPFNNLLSSFSTLQRLDTLSTTLVPILSCVLIAPPTVSVRYHLQLTRLTRIAVLSVVQPPWPGVTTFLP